MAGRLLTIRRALSLALLAAGAVVGREAYATLLGRNWHALVPNRVYRSAQLSGDELTKRVQAYGVRTVVNLRGYCPDFEWYQSEAAATCTADVGQEDVCLSASRLPPPTEVRRLVEIIERSEYPILLHCRQGVDRTGLAAVMVLLLTTDTPYAAARRQLSLRYGHVAFGPTRAMTLFFDIYDRWLADRGLAHSRERFRHWATREYCAGRCKGSLEAAGPVPAVRVGEPFAIRVRAKNLSGDPWPLRPGPGAGVHLRFVVLDETGATVQTGRAGLFRAEVAPGDSIDLTIAGGPLPRPGTYTVGADLLDGRKWAFSQYGMEPLFLELRVANRD